MKPETNKTREAGAGQTKNKRGFFENLYYAFNSIKLTVSLFITLGLVSIAGTIIEQGADPAKNAEIYTDASFRILNALGLFDMYHTFWFTAILLLLVLNLIVCTLERLPKAFRFVGNINPLLNEGDEKKYPFAEKLQVPNDPQSEAERLLRRYTRIPIWVILIDIAALASVVVLVRTYSMNFLEFTAFIVIPALYVVILNFRGKVVRTEQDGKVHLFLNQWLLSRFGVYITHVSILFIFLGAILGNLFGFKGYVGIPEGDTTNRIYIRQNKMIDTVSASVRSIFSGNKTEDREKDPHNRQEYMHLPFSIRCDDFAITYYGNTGRPKDYTSDLVVIKDGQEVVRKTIEVNDPLIVDNIYFYQSNYGPTGRTGQVVLLVSGPGAPTQEYRTPVNGSFRLQGTNTDIQVKSFIPDFTIVNGHVKQRSAEMINPAVYVVANQGQKQLFSGWVFPNYPDYTLKTDGYDFQFIDYWGSQYTGLQVTYDPGVEVVWIGCSLMIIGLMIAFFHSHQRIWIRVNGNEIVLAGSAHKNRMAFEKKFNQLCELLKQQ